MQWEHRKEDIIKLIKEVDYFCRNHQMEALAEDAEKIFTHLTQEKFHVVVCGEFKRGKSTLINAFLGEENLCPVNIDIATNMITSIKYGETEKITIAFQDDTTVPVVVPRYEVVNYVTEQGNRNNWKKIREVTVELPNKKLSNGVVIYDTPGVGALNKEHTVVSYQMISSADCAIFVSDAMATLSEPELNFVDMILKHCNHVLFVLTRIDLVGNYREVMENNRAKLAQVMKRRPDAIQIIPVSSRMKLMYTQTNDEDDLLDSNFDAFEQTMNDILVNKRIHLIQVSALEGIKNILTKVTQPLMAQFRAVQVDSKQRQQELQEEYTSRNARFKELQQENAEWTTQLVQGHQDIKRNIGAEFEQKFLMIQDNFTNNYLQDKKLLGKPEDIGLRLQAEIQALAQQTVESINQRAQLLHQEIMQTTGLDLGEVQAANIKFNREESKPQIGTIKKSDIKRKAFSSIRGFFMGGSVGGSTFGSIAILAGVTTLTVPVLLTGAAFWLGGAWYQMKHEWENLVERDEAAAAKVLRDGYSSWLNQVRSSLKKSIDDELIKLERHMKDGLKKEIKDQAKMCTAAVQNIQNAQQMSKEEAATQAGITKGKLQEIGKFNQEVERLISAKP